MTQEEKTNIDIDIFSLLGKFDKENQKDAALYVRGDSEFSNAAIQVVGNPAVLSHAMIHHMETHLVFRRFLLASVGAFISKNPEAEKEFMDGLSVLKEMGGN